MTNGKMPTKASNVTNFKTHSQTITTLPRKPEISHLRTEGPIPRKSQSTKQEVIIL